MIAGERKRVQIIDRLMVVEIKTGHERHILITDEMKDILYEHIKHFPKPLNQEPPLVLSRNKGEEGECKALSRQRLWAVIAQAAKDMGIEGSVGTHSLRKTWAYQAWCDGHRVDVIQTFDLKQPKTAPNQRLARFGAVSCTPRKTAFHEENGRVIIDEFYYDRSQKRTGGSRGEAERLGLKDKQDVVDMVKDVRRSDDPTRH